MGVSFNPLKAAQNFVNNTVNKANGVKEAVVNTAKDVFEAGAEKVNKVKEVVVEKANEVKEAVGNAVKATGEVVGNAVGEAIQSGKELIGNAVELVGDVVAGRDNPFLTKTISNISETLLSVVGEENVKNVIEGKFPILSPFIHGGEMVADNVLNAIASGLKATGLDKKLPFDVNMLDTANIGALLLNMEQDPNNPDVFHARKDCWQRSVGYNDLWDFGFGLGTSMRKEKFDFEYNGEEMMLWAWKGDYVNLGAGAELGIYTKYEDTDHWVADDRLELNMTMTLKDKEGNVIIDHSPEEAQWWITGFNSNDAYKGVQAADLEAEYTVDFSKNSGMFEAFYEKYGKNSETKDSRWTFDLENQKATFSF